MGVGNNDTRVVQGFVWATVKYVAKSSSGIWRLTFLYAQGFNEIDIALRSRTWDFLLFFIAYFILTKSNSSVKTIFISADDDSLL